MTLEGKRELFVNFDNHEKAATKAAMDALKAAGMNILADAKENLTGNHSVVTGQLRASGRVQKAQDKKQALDVGFFGKDTAGGYAYFVEYGRRAGKMPPVDYLVEWLRKKNSVSRNYKGVTTAFASALVFAGEKAEQLLRSTAFALAKSIAKKGTRPHPFFSPAVKKNEQAVADAIAQSVKETI